MKHRFIILFLLITLLFLMGCSSQSDSFALAICGSYGVPGMFCWDLKGNGYSCDIIESDSQGRVLFAYQAQSIISGKEEIAYIICQSIDDEFVYFYEDICYILMSHTESEIAELKEKNDWDKPLNFKKMSKRSNSVSFDLNIVNDVLLDFTKVQTACCNELKISKDQILELCFLDYDTQTCQLYLLITQAELEQDKYFVLVNTEYDAAFLRIEKDIVNPEELALFKQRFGWHWGIV